MKKELVVTGERSQDLLLISYANSLARPIEKGKWAPQLCSGSQVGMGYVLGHSPWKVGGKKSLGLEAEVDLSWTTGFREAQN